MRILMVTATYPPSVNGVAVTVENLKNSLRSFGHDVKVLAPDNNDASPDIDVFRYPAIPNPVIKDYPIPLFPGIKSVYKLVTSFKPEIVHTHHPFHIGFFARLIAKQFKAPLVFTYHTQYDLYAEKYTEFLPRKLKTDFINNSLGRFCKKVDLIISPSDFIKKNLIKKYHLTKIETVPAAVSNFKHLKGSKINLRKRLNLPLKKKILLAVARLGKEKNLEVLISSMTRLSKNYLLVVVGAGPDEERLKKITTVSNCGDKVKFVGRVDHKDIGLYYQAADIFYYSSLTETQGLVFLEALTFGLPIIAVRSAATSEWVTKDTGVLVGNNSLKLAKAVLNVTDAELKSMSKKAKVFSKRFSRKKLTVRLLTAYKQTIKYKK